MFVHLDILVNLFESLNWNECITNIFPWSYKKYNIKEIINQNHIDFEEFNGKLIFWSLQNQDDVFFDSREQKIINQLKITIKKYY